MKYGICPMCKRLIALTKNNKIFRHGWRSNAGSRDYWGWALHSGYNMEETKPSCCGSGEKQFIENLNLKIKNVI